MVNAEFMQPILKTVTRGYVYLVTGTHKWHLMRQNHSEWADIWLSWS